MSICQLDWDCFTSIATSVATFVGTVLAVSGFVGVVLEYIKRRSHKRAELLENMRRRFIEDYDFRHSYYELERWFGDNRHSEEGDRKLDDFPYSYWWNFISFLEEVALIVNSKLISEHVAYEMFGCYAVRFSEQYDKYSVRYSESRSRVPYMAFVKMDDLKNPKSLLGNFLNKMRNIENEKNENNYEFKDSDYRL